MSVDIHDPMVKDQAQDLRFSMRTLNLSTTELDWHLSVRDFYNLRGNYGASHDARTYMTTVGYIQEEIL